MNLFSAPYFIYASTIIFAIPAAAIEELKESQLRGIGRINQFLECMLLKIGICIA